MRKLNATLSTLLTPLIACSLLMAILPGVCLAQAGNPPSAQARTPDTTQNLNQRLKESNQTLAAKSSATRAAESQIGPDDLLVISIFEAPEMNRTLRVSSSGEISLQLLGTVKAAGLSPRELELVLQELLRRTYMKDPHVGVFVQELQSHPVSVVGAVKNPGVFQIRGTKTVIEMLSMAEGLADDAGDTVWIMRGAGIAETNPPPSQDSKVANRQPLFPAANGSKSDDEMPSESRADAITKVNLKDLLDSADSSLNVAVHPGDIVKVTRAGIVYVVGEVKKPGGFVLSNNENISVLQALALAEGLTKTSMKSQARIIRTDVSTGKRTEIPMDLGKILSSKAPDPTLQPKDIVFVPDSSAKSALYRGSETLLYTAAGLVIYRR